VTISQQVKNLLDDPGSVVPGFARAAAR